MLSASFSALLQSRARSDGTAIIHTDHMPSSRGMDGSSLRACCGGARGVTSVAIPAREAARAVAAAAHVG